MIFIPLLKGAHVKCFSTHQAKAIIPKSGTIISQAKRFIYQLKEVA